MTVTIAQLSDTHLDGSAGCRDRVRRVADFLTTLPAGPDVIVVTGDLTQRPPDVTDESAAAAAAVAEFDFLRGTLAGIGPPVLMAPGNSDDRASVVAAMGGDGVTQFNQRVEAAGLRFLLVDSTIPGEFAGRLDPDTLRWLNTELDAATGLPPTVLAMHHPPIALGHPVVDSLRLQNSHPLSRALSHRSRYLTVCALLVGHTHAATAARFAGRPLLVAPGVHSLGQLPWRADGAAGGLIDPTAPPGLALHLVDPNNFQDPVSYFHLLPDG